MTKSIRIYNMGYAALFLRFSCADRRYAKELYYNDRLVQEVKTEK